MSEKIATREAYGKALVELSAVNDKIVVLDADLAGATMTKHFKAAYPDRFYDCGIAEHDGHRRRPVHHGAYSLLLDLCHVRRRPCI